MRKLLFFMSFLMFSLGLQAVYEPPKEFMYETEYKGKIENALEKALTKSGMAKNAAITGAMKIFDQMWKANETGNVTREFKAFMEFEMGKIFDKLGAGKMALSYYNKAIFRLAGARLVSEWDYENLKKEFVAMVGEYLFAKAELLEKMGNNEKAFKLFKALFDFASDPDSGLGDVPSSQKPLYRIIWGDRYLDKLRKLVEKLESITYYGLFMDALVKNISNLKAALDNASYEDEKEFLQGEIATSRGEQRKLREAIDDLIEGRV